MNRESFSHTVREVKRVIPTWMSFPETMLPQPVSSFLMAEIQHLLEHGYPNLEYNTDGYFEKFAGIWFDIQPIFNAKHEGFIFASSGCGLFALTDGGVKVFEQESKIHANKDLASLWLSISCYVQIRYDVNFNGDAVLGEIERRIRQIDETAFSTPYGWWESILESSYHLALPRDEED